MKIDENKLISKLQKCASIAAKATSTLDTNLQATAFGAFVSYLLSIDGEKYEISKNTEVSPTPSSKRSGKPANLAKTTSGPKAWLIELSQEGFFQKPQSMKFILKELSERSHHLSAGDLTRPLETLCHDRVLRRKKIAATDKGSREVLHWVNW